MTHKEALKRALKELIQARINLDHGQKNGVPPEQMAALQEKVTYRETVVDALRPVTIDREAWEPCECCKPSENGLDPYGGHYFQIDGREIYYNDTDDGWEGEEINFCPWCARPLTEEAWAMLEKRIGGEV